jgi:hypothetical protein
MLNIRIGNTILIIDMYKKKHTHTHTYISIYKDKKKKTKTTTTRIFRKKKVSVFFNFFFPNRQQVGHRQAPNKYIMNLYHVHQLWLYD